MKRNLLVTAGVLFLIFGMTSSVLAGTRDNCISRCKEAASFVQSSGVEAAIKEITKRENRFTWNEGVSYVFLMNMECRMLAHPVHHEMMKSDKLIEIKDVNGKAFFKDFIKSAEKGKGWVKYDWSIPGKEIIKPKHTFIYRVPDTDYFVGAGFYVMAPGEFY
jgi:signal transduction histidine kinase